MRLTSMPALFTRNIHDRTVDIRRGIVSPR